MISSLGLLETRGSKVLGNDVFLTLTGSNDEACTLGELLSIARVIGALKEDDDVMLVVTVVSESFWTLLELPIVNVSRVFSWRVSGELILVTFWRDGSCETCKCGIARLGHIVPDVTIFAKEVGTLLELLLADDLSELLTVIALIVLLWF